MSDACPGCFVRKSNAMPQLASVCYCSWDACQASEGCWLLICCNRAQERGMVKYFHICMHAYPSGSVVLDPRASNHASQCMMAEESNCATQYRMNAYENTTRPNTILDNPECRRPGIETRSVTRSTKRPSFPVLGLTPIPSTIQYAWHAWMQLIYNLACIMLWNGIHDARDNMAYTMH